MKCSLCAGECVPIEKDLFDDRYGHPGLFSLVACNDCGHIMTLPSLREEDLPDLYGNYYPRKRVDVSALGTQVGEPGSFRAGLKRWLQGTDNQGQYEAKPGMKVLDYGCGAGVSLLEVRKLGGEAFGIEADPSVARIARHYCLNIHIGKLTEETFPGIQFDLVVLNQVIEHVPDPVELLQSLVARLNEGGRIIMSFPNVGSIYRRVFGRRWINWHIPYHLHHFTRKSFMTFAARLRLDVLELRTVTPNLWTVLQFRALSHRAQHGKPNPMWGGNDGGTPADNPGESVIATPSKSGLMNQARRHIKRLGLISASALVGIANRIIDLAGQGDSFVAVLKPQARE